MNLVILLTIFINVKIAQSVGDGRGSQKDDIKNGTGIPDSHKDALDQMLGAFLNDQDTDGSVFQYLFGVGNEKPSSIDFDNLDIATLDPDNLKKIVQRAKNKYETLQTRRLQYIKKAEPHRYEYAYIEKRAGLNKRKDLVVLAFDLMAQSIYSTRSRIMETRRHRRRYVNQPPYQIGVMMGSVMEIKSKMAHMFATMSWFPTRTHFIWYLILYEKMLAAFTDITNQCDRIFIIHKPYALEMQGTDFG